MNEIKARPSRYQILEKVGEGLTSCVFKALRCDPQGWTQQTVALKVLKSQKHIQVLRKEFEKLLQVRSKYCVKVLAWENLAGDEAIVMEYIDGMNLWQVMRAMDLSQALKREIAVQIYMGIKALHRAGFVHGDLQPKNILIQTDGLVKVIDFGFYDQESVAYLTPEYTSPKVLAGEPPQAESDFYSWEIICDKLGIGTDKKSLRTLSSRSHLRRELGLHVQSQKNTKGPVTTILQNSSSSKVRGRRGGPIAASLIFFLLLFVKPQASDPVRFTRLTVPGLEHWVSLSINGLPEEYLPVNKRRRMGQYKFAFSYPDNKSSVLNQELSTPTFLLKPNVKDLE